MPQEPRHASIARCVSMESMMFFLVKSHSVSRILTLGSRTDATRSRVSSSDFPTLTTTSSQTSSTERIAGTIGKSSLTAFRTSVKPDSMSGPELEVVQAPIQSVGVEQISMRAALDEAPPARHADEVAWLPRRGARGDHEHGRVCHQAIDRFLPQPLRLGVERAGRFVENQNRRIAQQCARDRDALATAARQPRAALVEHRGVALGRA